MIDRRTEVKLWTAILGILTLLGALGENFVKAYIAALVLAAVVGLITAANILKYKRLRMPVLTDQVNKKFLPSTYYFHLHTRFSTN